MAVSQQPLLTYIAINITNTINNSLVIMPLQSCYSDFT